MIYFPPIYIVDSSSLIDLQRYYPSSTFPSLWQNIDRLIHVGQFTVPDLVFEEINQKDDNIAAWLRDRKENVVTPASEYQSLCVSGLMKKYPTIVDLSSDRIQADPWVIACALDYREGPQRRFVALNPIIVTEEQTGGGKPKIPTVCREYEIPCISLVQMIVSQGWQF